MNWFHAGKAWKAVEEMGVTRALSIMVFSGRDFYFTQEFSSQFGFHVDPESNCYVKI